MWRVAIAELKQESNTFSPFATTYEAFVGEGYLLRGEALVARLWGTNTELGGVLESLGQAAVDVIPTVAAWSLSGGALTAETHSRLVADLLDGLSTAAPFDAILLVLHGALVAHGCDDVEGDLLRRLRDIYGSTLPIVCSLDMHANLTRAMLEHANVFAVYHSNPHVDFASTGRRAAHLLLRMLSGELEPTHCMLKLPWLCPPENSADSDEPMRGLLGHARDLEAQPDIKSAAILPCQPWLDVDELGSAVYIATHADAGLAANHAVALADRFWAARWQLDTDLVPVEEAIRLAMATPGLTVFSDCADSTTSGSSGDSTHVLEALLRSQFDRDAYVLVVDPVAAGEAAAAFAANQQCPVAISLEVGGRLDPVHHRSMQLEGEVLQAGEYHFTMKGQSFSGVRVDLGQAVVIRHGKIHVLITTRRVLTVDPELYRCVGLDPAKAGIVMVKSPIMYRANYRDIAARMLTIDAPGASPSNFTRLEYGRLVRPFFPWDRDLELNLSERVVFAPEGHSHANR